MTERIGTVRLKETDSAGTGTAGMSSAETGSGGEPVLAVRHLELDIVSGRQSVPILRDVSFTVGDRELRGIAGESGAGKSMTMYCLTSLLPRRTTRVRGEILFRGEDGTCTDLLKLSWKERQRFSAEHTCLILQDSINALNPFERIEAQWLETVLLHDPGQNRTAVRERILRQLDTFGIHGGEEVLRKYPHQLSGGMRQRIAIAMALESPAKLLIADEPTTSLDTINQRKIVEFIVELCRRRGLAMLYITHNLGIVQAVCDTVTVMKDGRIIEQGRTAEVFSDPQAAYTKTLLEGTRSLQK